MTMDILNWISHNGNAAFWTAVLILIAFSGLLNWILAVMKLYKEEKSAEKTDGEEDDEAESP